MAAGLAPYHSRQSRVQIGWHAMSSLGSRRLLWSPTASSAWLRNPMYVGGTLFLAGLAILPRVRLDAGDDRSAFVVMIHFGVVKREERYLEAKFGDAYRRNMSTVPRYGLPF